MLATSRTLRIALFVALVAAVVLVPVAFAAKGGGGGGGSTGGGGKPPKSTGGTYTGTVTGPVMVTDKNGNGLPNYGDSITFNVTSNATNYWVAATCSQNGAVVWQDTEGFSPGWLWGTTYYLGGSVWTGGAATCSAVLYTENLDGTNYQQLGTLSFSVGA